MFPEAFTGRVLSRRSDEWPAACRLFNKRIDHQPNCIVFPKSADDVTLAVRLARAEGLEIRLRGSGHNPAGHAMAADCLLIDMSHMRRVVVSRDRQSVFVEAGATWAEFDATCAPCGRSTTGGSCSMVSVVGFVLAGGYGLLGRQFGMGCDQLLDASLVTADGSQILVSERQNADLFWALRGAGNGNFGVVTSVRLRLHKIPKQVTGGITAWPLDQAEKIVPWTQNLLRQKEFEPCSLYVNYARYPYPHGQPSIVVRWHSTDKNQYLMSVIEDAKKIAPPRLVRVGRFPYAAVQRFSDPDLLEFGQHLNGYWKSGYFNKPIAQSEAVLISDFFSRAPSAFCRIHLDQPTGGAITHPDRTDCAFAHRHQTTGLQILSLWQDSADQEKSMTWANQLIDALSPGLTGAAYAGYADDGLQNGPAAYYGKNLARLLQIKKAYDPENIFCHAQGLGQLITDRGGDRDGIS